MQSPLSNKETDPHDLFVIEPDVVLATRPGKELAGKDLAGKAPDIARQPADRPIQTGQGASSGTSAPSVDATFRATARDGQSAGGEPSVGRWAISALMAVLLAVCSAVAAAAWQRYGDDAQQVLARLVPRFTLTSAAPAAPEPAAQASTSAAQPAPSGQAAIQPPAPAQPPASAAAAAAPDSTQALQSMAHDLAEVGRQVGELKASIDQLKASQEQLSHEIARISEAKAAEARLAEARLAELKAAEQRLRQRPSPRSMPMRKPAPIYTPTQSAVTAPPAANPPLRAEPLPVPSQDGPVIRPPMPVR